MNTGSANVTMIAQKLVNFEYTPIDLQAFSAMLNSAQLVTAKRPERLIAGVDSSDNLLLNIPNHPGAAIAGYSFSLVVSDPDGILKFANDWTPERSKQLLTIEQKRCQNAVSPMTDNIT